MAIMSSAAGNFFILHVLEKCEIPIDSQVVNNTQSAQRKNTSEDLWACDGEQSSSWQKKMLHSCGHSSKGNEMKICVT